MRHLNVARPLALYVVICLACMAQSLSCGGNNRMKTVNVAIVTLDTAKDAFFVWTRDHRKAIIDQAATKAEAEQKLAAYIVEQDKIKDGFWIAYDALRLAATTDDDASVQAALATAADLYARIKAFTASFEKKPPAPPPNSPPPDGGL